MSNKLLKELIKELLLKEFNAVGAGGGIMGFSPLRAAFYPGTKKKKKKKKY